MQQLEKVPKVEGIIQDPLVCFVVQLGKFSEF